MSTSNDSPTKSVATVSDQPNFTSDGANDTFMTNELNSVNRDFVDVIITGAGIGGLVTALCLHRAGISVRIFERARKLEPTGFGVNLQPYCVKLLHELGLKDAMDASGIRTSKTAHYSRNGQFIYEELRGIDAGYSWPMYSMHRGHFQELLLRRVRDEVGETSINLSQKLIGFRSQPNHVEVEFVNPVTDQRTTVMGKILVGADGISSTVRKILYPNEGPPLWNGTVLWRGVTHMDKMYLDGRTMVCMGNPNHRFMVFYPVSKNLVHWTCVIRVEDPGLRPSPETLDWDNIGNIEDLFPLISDMKLDFLDIRHLLKSSPVVYRCPVTDRDVLTKWTYDRVTLLGDAAHPMYPYGGNGASQAIIDARALVLCFRSHGVTPQGLKAYDDLRRETSHTFVLTARELGPLKILQTIDEHSPLGFRSLSEVISPSEIEAILSKYRQLSGWNAQQLNQEPPLF